MSIGKITSERDIFVNQFRFCARHGDELCQTCCCDHRMSNNVTIEEELGDVSEFLETEVEVSSNWVVMFYLRTHIRDCTIFSPLPLFTPQKSRYAMQGTTTTQCICSWCCCSTPHTRIIPMRKTQDCRLLSMLWLVISDQTRGRGGWREWSLDEQEKQSSGEAWEWRVDYYYPGKGHRDFKSVIMSSSAWISTGI